MLAWQRSFTLLVWLIHTSDLPVNLILFVQYSRRVKIMPPESPFFTLSAPQFAGRTAGIPASLVASSSDGKVAPHATVQYTLTFVPQARADYSLDLLVVTEREKFLLPVRVFGDRGMYIVGNFR